MRYKVSFLFLLAALALAVGLGSIPGLETATAGPRDPAGTRWNGFLDGVHAGVQLQNIQAILARDGIRSHGNILVNHLYLVRIEIKDTGGGNESYGEVLLQFTSPPVAALGKGWADNNQPNRASIGNLESCPMRQGKMHPGHTCPTNYNSMGWVNLTAAVNRSNRVLIINDPNAGWQAGTIVWFAFDQPQNRIPYDIIEKAGANSFGFGKIDAKKFIIGAAPPAATPPPRKPRKRPVPPPPSPPPPKRHVGTPNMYVIGTLAVGRNFSIHRWTGSTFVQLPGGGRTITVDSNGTPWITDNNNQIFKWNGASWTQMAGAAIDIAAGGGKVYVIGTLPKGGGNYSIHRWTGSTWAEMPGGGVRIAAQSNGIPWVVDANHNIYKWTGSTWSQVAGAAGDIGAGGGKVFVIGTLSVGGGNFSIHKWTGTTWTQLVGGGVRIDADRNGNPWVLDAARNIYKWNGTTFKKVPGAAIDIGAE